MSINIPCMCVHAHLCVRYRSVEEGPVSLSRCSCCEARSPSSWTSSSPTPRLTNICPSPAFSSDIDLCLAPLSGDWQEHPGSKPCHLYFLGNWAFCDVKCVILNAVRSSGLNSLVSLMAYVPSLTILTLTVSFFLYLLLSFCVRLQWAGAGSQ